jgi:hypothetical protein
MEERRRRVGRGGEEERRRERKRQRGGREKGDRIFFPVLINVHYKITNHFTFFQAKSIWEPGAGMKRVLEGRAEAVAARSSRRTWSTLCGRLRGSAVHNPNLIGIHRISRLLNSEFPGF